MTEYTRKGGSNLFPSQVEFSLGINGWDHTSLMFKKPADFDPVVYAAAYAESKAEINPSQVARFAEALSIAKTPFIAYDTASSLWTIGTDLVKPAVVADKVLARARAWKSEAGGRMTGMTRWDNTSDGLAAGRFSRLTCALITPAEGFATNKHNTWRATLPAAVLAEPFFDENKSIRSFVEDLGLVPDEWTKLTSLYGRDGSHIAWFDCHYQIDGQGCITGLRNSGICKRGHSYILTSPDAFGNCAIL